MKFSKSWISLVLLMVVIIFSCEGEKNMFKNANELINIVEQQTPVVILGDRSGAMIAVTPEYGGKVIAMSVDGIKGENLIWPNPELANDNFWNTAKSNWNIGGARTWIAPEADFYLDQENNWFVPEQMDPGNYQLVSQQADKLTCSNRFDITNIYRQEYKIKITRSIEIIKTPPLEISKDVKYIGLKLTHELQNLTDKIIGKDIGFIGLWSLIQLDTAGTMIIPIIKDETHDNITVRDYGPDNFNAVPPERMTITDNWVAVKIDGKFRCKLGFAPWAVKNSIGYLRYQKDSQDAVLYLKEFSVDADGKYVDHPWEKPYDYGDAIQLYNDDGTFGGFCEIECHGPARELKPGEEQSHSVVLSVFTGKLNQLRGIAADRLGINIEEVELF